MAASFLSGVRAAGAAVTPPSLYEILKEPGVLHAAISPSGKQVAVLGQHAVGSGFGTSISLIDGDDPSAAGKRLDLGDMDVERIAWANDERLLVWLKREFKITVSGPYTRQDSSDLTVRRLLAIGADGSKPVLLFENKKRDFKGNINLGNVVDFMPADPDHIVMQAADYDRYVWALYRVNVTTGAAELLERGTPFTYGWESFDGRPIARYDTNNRGTAVSVLLRTPGAADYTPFRTMRPDENGRVDFTIVGATDDPNVVLVTAREQGDETLSVRTFDLRTRQVGTATVRRPTHDVESVVQDRGGRMLATAFIDDRVGYEFADPSLKAHHRAIDGFFGKACNVWVEECDAARNRFLFWVTGPKEPGAYFLYDKATKALEPLGAARDWLTPERTALVEALAVKTRDGQALTAYLTIPVAVTGPRPLVVLPHGGPEMRDQFDWDDWAQALAAQGWLVMQPNFRGSGGYGQAFAEAGWRRWGDRMQEDVEDCVAQVVASGRVDTARIAIMGASYGGYAALMGAVRRPELYKASVSIAGVSDLPQMLTWERNAEGSDSPSYQFWQRRIGDPDADRAMLEAASPRRRADAIAAPVLLIHGKKDEIVPVEQSKLMRDALKKAGKTVDYLEIEDMGHNGWKPQQSQVVLGRAIEFLGARLKA